MLLRRFLLICSALVLINLVSRALVLSFPNAPISQHIAHAATHDRMTQSFVPNCPNTSDSSQGQPSLAFCSPQYQGNFAGPFGTHITLVGKNITETLTTWIITRNKPTQTAQDLRHCTPESENNCTLLPPPTQTNPQAKMTLFAWTWTNSFPNIPGSYFITGISSSTPTDPSPQFVSTQLPFILLTSQAPCITLNNSTCTSSPQIYSIHPDNTKKLIIHGSHWVLGWQQNAPITESIDIIATCTTISLCSTEALFYTVIAADQVDIDGTFTYSLDLPTNIQGNYSISAFNSVPQVISHNHKNNTIADGTLSFGEPDDANTLNINLTPTSPLLPKVNIAALDIIAFVAILLAAAGIFAFLFALLKKQSDLPQLIPPTTAASGSTFLQTNFTSSMESKPQFVQVALILQKQVKDTGDLHTTTPKISPFSSNTTSQGKIFSHAHPLVDLPPLLQQTRTPWLLHVPFLKSILEKRVEKALDYTKQSGDLQKIIDIVPTILSTDITRWNELTKDFDCWSNLIQLLKERSSNFDQDMESIEQDGIRAIQAIQREPSKTKLHCSRALVYYSVCLNVPPPNLQKKADILFDMGFAYTKLAFIMSNNFTQIIDLACINYTEALSIYEQLNEAHLSIKTWIASGDVCFALLHYSGYRDMKEKESASKHYQYAQKLYQEAIQIYGPQNDHLFQEISQRIQLLSNY